MSCTLFDGELNPLTLEFCLVGARLEECLPRLAEYAQAVWGPYGVHESEITLERFRVHPTLRQAFERALPFETVGKTRFLALSALRGRWTIITANNWRYPDLDGVFLAMQEATNNVVILVGHQQTDVDEDGKGAPGYALLEVALPTQTADRAVRYVQLNNEGTRRPRWVRVERGEELPCERNVPLTPAKSCEWIQGCLSEWGINPWSEDVYDGDGAVLSRPSTGST